MGIFYSERPFVGWREMSFFFTLKPWAPRPPELQQWKNLIWCTVENVEDFRVIFAAIFPGNWRTKICEKFRQNFAAFFADLFENFRKNFALGDCGHRLSLMWSQRWSCQPNILLCNSTSVSLPSQHASTDCHFVWTHFEPFFGEGDATKHFSVRKKRIFQWKKGGGNSVNEGFGKDFYRKGNSLKMSGPFSQPPDSENWQVAVLILFPKISSYSCHQARWAPICRKDLQS